MPFLSVCRQGDFGFLPVLEPFAKFVLMIWKIQQRKSDEVKGEGYILNLILYSFFRVFPIFDPRVLF